MIRCWAAATLLAAAFNCNIATATSQTSGQEVQFSATDVFDLAERAKAEGRDADAIILYDALSANPDIEVRSEALFRKGQLLAARARWRDAALAYRRLLDGKPNAARVRLELAMVLTRLGDEIGARRQIRLAQAAGLPAEVAEQVSQFSRALRSPKRVGGAFEITLAPDTNINRGTEATTLDTVIAPLLLDSDARERSGVGMRMRMRVSGFAKQPLTDRLSLLARAAGSGDIYRGGDTNDIFASALAGVEWQGPRDRIAATYGFGRRWYGNRAFADTYPLTVEWLRELSRTSQTTVTVSRSAVDYQQNPLQTGALYDASVSVEKALSAGTGVGVGASATRQTSLDASYGSIAFGPLLYGWHEMGRTTLFASATGRRLIGDARNFLFTDKRREMFVSARAGVILRQWSFYGLSPTIRVGYERNHSTVSIYDYRRTFAEVGVSRTF